MANTKLSKTPGYISTPSDMGALEGQDWIYNHNFPIIAEDSWHPSDESGDTYHNVNSHSFESFDKTTTGLDAGSGKGSDLVQVSNNQFGIGMGCWNPDQNKIYYSLVPFQVSDAGAITKGTVSSTSNSSGKNLDGSQWHSVGFNNTTSGSIQGIPANSANVLWYGRQYWNGNYYMMSWGGRFNTSNTVATISRNDYSDYNSNYPRPKNEDKRSNNQLYGWYPEQHDDIEGHSYNDTTFTDRRREGHPDGNIVLTGGNGQTPYYHMIGHDTNSYSHWSRWSYNSGSYPSHNSSNNLATHNVRGSAGIPVAQTWDSPWDHVGGYYYYHTTRQFGFGLISSAGSQNTVATDMDTMFPKQGVKDKCFVIPLRFASNLVIWLNYKTGEFYTNNGVAATMVESIGSPNQMTPLEKQKMQEILPKFPSYNNGSYSEKPIRQPTTAGTVSTLYTSANWQGGLMIKKWTYNSTGKVLTCDHQYASPSRFNPGTVKFQRYRFAGTNQNILVNTTISDNSLLTVKTYDVSKMFTALGIS